MAVLDWDLYEESGGFFRGLRFAMRGLIIAGVVVGPLIVGGLLGWTVTLMFDENMQARLESSSATRTLTEGEVRAVGLSQRAVIEILAAPD